MDILDYRRELNNCGVTLHTRIITLLLDEIVEAFIMGDIRSNEDGHSIYDFISHLLKKGNPRQVFNDLKDSDEVVRGMDNFTKFDGQGQRETPVTNMVGLLYIAYMVSSEFSQKLRSASASQILVDNRNKVKDWIEPIAKTNTVAHSENFPELIGRTQDEIYQLASDYLQIRQAAAEQLPTLIDILDSLADPAYTVPATDWFTAKAWLAANGYTMIQRQQRQFFLAIAECHRFLVVATPQKRDGVNYYSNQHDLLLRTCANNTLKLGLKRTMSFV